MKRFSILSSVTAVLIVLANAMSAEAVVDATTTVTAATAAAPANWNTGANWTGGTAPNGIDDTARFSNIQTALRTLTLSSDTTVGHIVFDNGQNNRQNVIGVLSATAPVLTFDVSSGSATIDVTGASSGANTPNNIFGAVVLNDDLIISVARSATTSAAGEFTLRAGNLTGTGGVTKNGTGVMTFADNPKAYSGPTIINDGRLRLNGTSNITGTSSIFVNSGGQFDIEGSVDYTFGGSADVVITLNGFGLGQTSPAGNFPGAIRTGSGLLAAIENKIVLASASSINVVSTNPVTTPGKLNLFNEISGPGRLIANQKAGLISREGFLYLAHSNTYSGGTTVEQGTLTVTSALSADANLGTGNVFLDGVSLAFDGNPDGAASGKLVIESGVTNAIADTAYLYLTGGGTAGTADRGYVNLAADINETVGGLMVGGNAGIGGLILGPGTYGAPGSGAANPGLSNPEEYFAGSSIVTVVSAGVPGDYNNNGGVDAGDYVVWKKGGPLANDFTPGNQAEDYTFWRSRFGANTNPGSGSGLQNAAVPEPSTIALAGCLISLLTFRRRPNLLSS